MRTFLIVLLSVLASQLAFGRTLYTFNGGGTGGSWSNGNIWTTDPTGSTSVSPGVPQTNDVVVITNSFVVQLTADVATTGLDITVQRGGQLDLGLYKFTNTLAHLAGQGTLRINQAYFPAVTTNDFDDAGQGTVEFYDWAAGTATLPTNTSAYNNLRLLNATANAYTVQLDNNLTINGNLTLLRTNNAVLTLNIGKAATARTLNVLGNIAIGDGTSLGVTNMDLPTVTNNNNVTTQTFHTLNVSGSFVNNGTVNLHNGTTNDKQTALLNFKGNTNTNFACNGPTDLGILQVDKGIDSQVTLNITATVDQTATNSNLRLRSVTDGIDRLNLINGVARLGGNILLPQIHNGNDAGTGFTIGATVTAADGSSYITSPTLWIDGATLINNNANGTAIYGTFRISGGRYENLTNDAMVLREDGQILIEGGQTYVDRMRPSNTSKVHRGAFTITGGEFYCKGSTTAPRNTNYARFSIPLLTESFRMTGGTIQIENPDNAVGMFHIGVNANNAIISGGTIVVVLPASNTNGAILSTAPLWNLTVVKAGTNGSSKALLTDIAVADFTAGTYTSAAQPLTVLNNFTIGLSSLNGTNYYPATFDATGAQRTPTTQNVTIQGTLAINSGSTYLPGSNTTFFTGGQNQLLTNNGAIGTANNAFNNLTMDKSAGTLTLGGSNSTYTVGGTLSLLNGVLSDGGKTLRAMGNVVNSATHTSDGGNGSIMMAGSSNQIISGNDKGIFGNLSINSTMAAGSVAVTTTANLAVASTLTMMSNTILNIGANRLSLTNVLSSGANAALVLGPDLTSFSASCFIQTAGNQSDLGLQKTYGKGDSFLFPVGTITVSGTTTTVRYAPATIELRLATSAALDKFGQVSVSPVASRNPFVASTTNSLAYYWKVRSTGFGSIPNSSIYETFRMTNADAAGTLSSYVPGRYLPTAWTKYSGTVSAGNNSATIAFSALDNFPGEFTAGDPSTFGDVTAYYSTGNGTWKTPGTWKTITGNNAAQAATTAPGSNNPVFIGSAANKVYHTVTVDANNAKSGSLVIDRGSVMDVGTTTGHNFGALPDAKVGGSGRLRVSASGTTVTFPGGDFGSFIQENGGTVEYYTGASDFTVPTASGTLTLNQYRNLWLNAGSSRNITLPNQDLRVYAQLKTGVPYGSTTYTGTVLLSAGTSGNLRADSLLAVQAGTLSYANGTARTVTADTDVRVDASATFNVTTSGTAVANALTVGRSLTNNGTLDLFNSTTTGTGNTATTTIRKVDLTFTSAQNGNFTGTTSAAFTDLATMTLNKGQGQASQLTMDVVGTLTTPTRNWLTLTNGTLRYTRASSTALTIHDDNTPYLIPETAGLTIDGANANATVATSTVAPANNTSSPSDLRLGGQLQVLQGTLSVGTTGNYGNDLEYASAGAPGIRIGATGTLYVNGQIRRTTANTDGALRYDQVGGTVNIDGARATVYQNNERGLFEVQGKGSIFRMSGGTLALRGSNGRPTIIADLYVRPDSTVVTSGTVQLGNTANSNLTVSVESLVPLWDMQVMDSPNGGSNTGLLTGVNPLSLKGSLTIASSSAIFNANGLGLNIDQHLINNNTSATTALNSGGFRPGTTAQTTTFTGKGPALQRLQGAAGNLTVFGSLTTSNAQASGALQLERNARVTGTLTIAKGTLADNGQTLTVLGDVVNTAVHTSTGSGSLILGGTTNQNVDGNNKGKFGNLTLSNTAGATTLANQEVTGVLTLGSGVLTIGSNLLWLSNTAAGAVTGQSNTSYIRTNGIVADLGLRKSYPSGAQDFTFPVGAAAKYTPVSMNVKANSAAGTLTVKPVDLAHPSTTDNANNTEISFYWKVSSTGFSQPTVDHAFTYASNDVNGTESNYKLGRFVNGAWVPKGGVAPTTLSTDTHTISKTGLTYFDGDYTAGYANEFQDVPTYYSRNRTAGQTGGANWDDKGTWTFNADGTDSSTMPDKFPTTANPVVILAGHLVNSNGPGRGAGSLQLLGTLDLAANAANNFNVVTGTGTVKIGSTLFPAGNYATFVDTNGGTVEYTGGNQLPARDTYNNLTFSGTNTKPLSNLDLTINGALTVAAGTTVNNPTNQAITLTSNTLGMSVSGTFNLGDGLLSTTAGLATTTGGTLNLGAGTTTVGTSFVNEGTLNAGSGDLQVGTALSNKGTFNASAGNVLVGTTFSNSNNYQAGQGSLQVAGNFTNEATGTFANATGDVSTQGNFVNYGTYGNSDGIAHTLRISGSFSNLTATIPGQRTSAGSFIAAGNSVLVVRGDFTNANGTGFDAGNSLVQFIYDESHTLTGPTTFFNLRKQGAGLLTLGNNTDVSVGQLLTMQSGLIQTGRNTLTLLDPGSQPVVGATPISYIAGRLAMSLPTTASTRVYPVGLGGRYRPVTLRPQSTDANTKVVVEIVNSAPGGSVDATLSNISANRYYRVQTLAGNVTNPTVQLSFNTDVVDEEVHVPGNLRVARATNSNGPWSTANGAGVFSPDDPRGYTTSAATTVDGTSLFALASTNKVDNPLTGSAPLPVQLLHFAAARQGSNVRLSWATASELHSSHFVVQRSADGHTFADVQQVAAQGSTTTRHDYTALDRAPLPGLSYYRLQQVDQDGTYAYSPIATVRFDGDGAQPLPALLAYPNPSNGQRFSLQAANLATTGGTVQLFDNVGRLLLTQVVAAGSSDATIQPAQPLPSGLYFATWQAPDGTKLGVKVVVE